ncbi:MAG: response regulator [Burkholderiales bacterium]|nr:response regulator [Burkholderiales bacterium]
MSSSGCVLIVDDDSSVRAVIAEYLGENGYETMQADSGEAMREALGTRVPDVVLLDVRLGREDGLSLARYLREHFDLGIIMVTAAGDIVDRVVGLEVGADDYIAKPFDPRELRARLRSVMRRLHKSPVADPVTPAARGSAYVAVGSCKLDLSAHRLFDAANEEIALTSMEFDLLKVFTEHPNQVLSRDQLLNFTRNRDWQPFDRSIDIRIARLRRKIEPDPDHPQLIKTIRNAGYMYTPRPR